MKDESYYLEQTMTLCQINQNEQKCSVRSTITVLCTGWEVLGFEPRRQNFSSVVNTHVGTAQCQFGLIFLISIDKLAGNHVNRRKN